VKVDDGPTEAGHYDWRYGFVRDAAMPNDHAKLMEDTAASVADGSDVDWQQIEVRLADDGDRKLLQQLRVIAGIADVHRSTPDVDGGDERDSPRGRIVGAILPQKERQTALPPGTPATWGRLTVLELVGRGTFGEVFRAHDTQLDREVALKLLRVDGRRSRLAERLLHEGRVLAKVRHNNVVAVYGVEDYGGRVGMWMELLRGSTLDALVTRQGAMSAREASLIGQDLCRALAAVHGAGLVHRDLKAQNVMREQGGRVVLMDFGAGESLAEPGSRRRGRITGTPLYLAPELLEGRSATVQSDIYALGVLLYYLVTLRYPVDASTVEELKAAHAAEAVRHLHDARPDLPDAFVSVVERSLRRDPAQRFPSAGAMQAALASSLGMDLARTSELPIAPVSEPAAQPVKSPSWRWAKLPQSTGAPTIWRRAWPWGWTAFAALVALILAGLATWPATKRLVGLGTPPPLLVVQSFSSASPADAYFASGLADHVVTKLGRLSSQLSVSPPAAWTSGSGLPSSEVAARLRADYVAQGRVERTAAGATVTVSLLRAGSPSAFWTRTYARGGDTILQLEDDIVGGLTDALHVVAAAEASKAQAQRVSPEAMDTYLRGRYHLKALQPDRAIEPLTRAVTLEPTFAVAWAVLGRAYIERHRYDDVDRRESYERARAAAEQALALDPELADAHTASATVAYISDWDWTLAAQEFQRALNLDPASEAARLGFVNFLWSRGRAGEAVRVVEEGLRLNPLSSDLMAYSGMSRYYARDYHGAIADFKRALLSAPNPAATFTGLCRTHLALGERTTALEYCQQALDEKSRTLRDDRERRADRVWNAYRSAVARVYAVTGRQAEARAILSDLLALRAEQPQAVMSESVALLHLALGDHASALAEYEQAAAERTAGVLYLAVDPRVDPLRGNPRFDRLLSAIGLAP
jgi:serine/threonine protein kinase/tetratricopeptide (TPR) repeat protein